MEVKQPKVNSIGHWLSKSPQERLAEVTRLIQKDLKPGQRMDKTKFSQIRLKDK
jgi:hypothetical protein